MLLLFLILGPASARLFLASGRLQHCDSGQVPTPRPHERQRCHLQLGERQRQQEQRRRQQWHASTKQPSHSGPIFILHQRLRST